MERRDERMKRGEREKEEEKRTFRIYSKNLRTKGKEYRQQIPP